MVRFHDWLDVDLQNIKIVHKILQPKLLASSQHTLSGRSTDSDLMDCNLELSRIVNGSKSELTLPAESKLQLFVLGLLHV